MMSLKKILNECKWFMNFNHTRDVTKIYNYGVGYLQHELESGYIDNPMFCKMSDKLFDSVLKLVK